MPKEFFKELSDHKTPPTYKYFDGEAWKVSLSGKTSDIISPIDGKVLGKVQQVTFVEIDRAIERAKKAQEEWARVPMIKRTKPLHLAADWIREHEKFLTRLLIQEIGKTYEEAKDEILRSADMIDHFCHEALHLAGEELSGDAFPGYDQTKMAIVERVPLGVVVAISPFNYPVNLSVSKIVPALLTGNTCVFKPPTYGSISAVHLTEIFRIAGVPDGVLVTITGEGSTIGDYLVTHKEIAMVTYTGSSEVGRSIATKIGMIPLLFECGGNNPALVLPDTDLDATSTEIVKGAFSYSGQRCTAIKYVLGLKPTIQELVPLVIKKTKTMMRIGNPKDERNNFGPVITENAAHEIEKRILEAKAHGAKIVLGGKRDGLFVEPTILTDVKPTMEIVQRETFGPVVSFLEVKSIDEALSIINASEYGLQASIFTKDEGTGIRLAQKIGVGTVQVNSKPQRGPDHFPFLGVKGSGIGVQGIRYSLEAMTRFRSIVLNSPK
ncbi:aldehyde dehydrogenase family protein [Candidatus Gottesmanbacteria bacterium]|nr:aldehyde dehydrogenase family protein [Candidatus Gottesmanbacteria bacterium]